MSKKLVSEQIDELITAIKSNKYGEMTGLKIEITFALPIEVEEDVDEQTEDQETKA